MKEYLEGVDLLPQEFCEKILHSTELPKTSQPSPEAFIDCFKALYHKLHGSNDGNLCR